MKTIMLLILTSMAINAAVSISTQGQQLQNKNLSSDNSSTSFVDNYSQRDLRRRKKKKKNDTTTISNEAPTMHAVMDGSSSHIELSVTATDPKGIKRVRFRVNFEGQRRTRTFTARNIGDDRYAYTLEDIPAGTHSWTAIARNKERSTDRIIFGPYDFEVQMGTPEPTLETSSTPSSTPTTTPSTQPSTSFSSSPSQEASQTADPTSTASPKKVDAARPPPSGAPSSKPTKPEPSFTPSKTLTQSPTLPPSSDSNEGLEEAVFGLQADCFAGSSSQFDICLDLRSESGNYESWMDSFAAARNRWKRIITDDDGFEPFANSRIAPYVPKDEIGTELPPTIDDLYISGIEMEIDSVGNIIGMAGPTVQKIINGKRIPLVGVMKFDKADIPSMQRIGSWRSVIEHEMGHVLGIGTMFQENGLHNSWTNAYQSNSYAQQAWEDMGCTGGLPIELDGGPGTAGAHWDEDCLKGELMTGFVENNGDMPLSKITAGALKDLGYGVNMDAADDFRIEDLGRCGSSCPAANRKLRRRKKKKHNVFRHGNKVSEKAHEEVLKAAAKELARNRANAPTFLPAGTEYVAGDFITVYIQDPDDGHIKGEFVTWEDVKGYVTDSMMHQV